MTELKEKIDCFSIFGLTRSYVVDEELLNKSYIEKQSESHPDRFINAEESQKSESIRKTAELNHAYSVLTSDERRARHMLELAGVDMTGEEEILQSPEILEEAFELREKLSFAETLEDVNKIKKESIKDMESVKIQFNDRYTEGDFNAAGEIYKKMIYKGKFLKEINSKSREL